MEDVEAVIGGVAPVSAMTVQLCVVEACERGCVPLLDLLVSSGRVVPSVSALTPLEPCHLAAGLQAAAMHGHVEVLQWLLDRVPGAAHPLLVTHGADWASAAQACAAQTLPTSATHPVLSDFCDAAALRLLQTAAWVAGVADVGGGGGRGTTTSSHTRRRGPDGYTTACAMGLPEVVGAVVHGARLARAHVVAVDAVRCRFVVLCCVPPAWATCSVDVVRDDDTASYAASKGAHQHHEVSVTFLRGSRALVYQFRDLVFHYLQTKEWVPMAGPRVQKTAGLGGGGGGGTSGVDASCHGHGPLSPEASSLDFEAGLERALALTNCDDQAKAVTMAMARAQGAHHPAAGGSPLVTFLGLMLQARALPVQCRVPMVCCYHGDRDMHPPCPDAVVLEAWSRAAAPCE
jgi:hypothetical protein